jgi:hypothetical protein
MRLLLIILLGVFLPVAAQAGGIDFAALLTDLDGQPIPDCVGNDCANKPALTLGVIAIRCLTANFPDEEKSISGEEKFKRGELALRIHKDGKTSLTAEDVALLKKLVGKAYGPLIVVKTWALLDPAQK